MGLFLFRLKLIMKIEICPHGGYKIYPGRGRTLIKQDGKTFKFLDSRSHKAHLLKRNPRKVTWTVLYRRKHRKGIEKRYLRNVRKELKSFRELLLEPHFKTFSRNEIRSPMLGRHKESKLLGLQKK